MLQLELFSHNQFSASRWENGLTLSKSFIFYSSLRGETTLFSFLLKVPKIFRKIIYHAQTIYHLYKGRCDHWTWNVIYFITKNFDKFFNLENVSAPHFLIFTSCSDCPQSRVRPPAAGCSWRWRGRESDVSVCLSAARLLIAQCC